MRETQATVKAATEHQSVGYIQAVDTPALTSGNLRMAVDRCLAAGMSPRAISYEVGLAFWSLVKGGVANPERARRWPRDPMGGWSDSPCPAAHERGVMR
jgi:hypothetical protein